MLTRTGESLRVWTGPDERNLVEIGSERDIYLAVRSLRLTWPYLLTDSVSRFDALAFFGVLRALGKPLVRLPNKEDKERLFRRYPTFEAECCQVEFAGRKLTYKGKVDSAYALFLRNEYNVTKGLLEGKTVIDGGANVGVFSLMCAALGAKRVYAFEPVSETYDLLVENIKMNDLQDVVIPIKKAVGETRMEAEIKFASAGDAGASISIERGAARSERIEIVRLDDQFGEERIDFIKLDVEGFEKEALNGASKIIRRDKPILSFSAYHKAEDKAELPKVLRGIRPDYDIKLNAYADPDFFCV